ncbi:MAG: hypothetical protein HKM02_11915 [Pseudomonadales bacterium]|nr:hypothetical protein [Pseudomonadales bacterium]
MKIIVTLLALLWSFQVLAVDTPERGMVMTSVALKFGEPKEKLPAVGNPPIVRWVYPGYVVYFQDDYVIDTVLVPATPPAHG